MSSPTTPPNSIYPPISGDLGSSGPSSPMSDDLAEEAVELLDTETEEQFKTDLNKIEKEIRTLREVLHSKERHAADLKRRLGITPIQEVRQNVKHGWDSLRGSTMVQNTSKKVSEWNDKMVNSDTYQKSKTVLQSATTKTTAAFTTVGSSMAKKLGEVRDSNTFKSFEEKVGTTVTTLKTSIVGKGPEDEKNFEEVLTSADSGSDHEINTEP